MRQNYGYIHRFFEVGKDQEESHDGSRILKSLPHDKKGSCVYQYTIWYHGFDAEKLNIGTISRMHESH
jgi:hypothetical protein